MCSFFFYIFEQFVFLFFFFFFFNDTATTEIYTLSLHDALPISHGRYPPPPPTARSMRAAARPAARWPARGFPARSEEHTSELQSRVDLVCRPLLEKKKEELTNARRLQTRKVKRIL